MKASIPFLQTDYARCFLCIVLLLIAAVACLNPPHDNEYDPENPAKAYVSGTVYGLNDQPVSDAEITLWQDATAVDTVWSDADGFYEFDSIDPGIYGLTARAPHYVQWECYPESLPADTAASIDVWFCAQFYCFEEESPGTVQPFGFDTISGAWTIIEDGSEPDQHSAPNVYHGENTAAGPAAVLLRFSGPDFHLETKFKVSGSSAPGWLTGAVFGFHDDTLNYYFVGVTHMGIGLNKITGGIIDTIQAIPHTFLSDTWYDLVVQMNGNDIYVYADGAEMNYADNQPFFGKAGLWIECPGAQALVNFDDVLIGR